MIYAIIQARMGSTRLPGKVMMDLCGHPVIAHVVNRLNEVTEEETDSIIFHEGDELRVDFANNEVYLNDVKDMRYIDIGSEFFEIEPGEYDLRISSDADITSSIIFNERGLD